MFYLSLSYNESCKAGWYLEAWIYWFSALFLFPLLILMIIGDSAFPFLVFPCRDKRKVIGWHLYLFIMFREMTWKGLHNISIVGIAVGWFGWHCMDEIFFVAFYHMSCQTYNSTNHIGFKNNLLLAVGFSSQAGEIF